MRGLKFALGLGAAAPQWMIAKKMWDLYHDIRVQNIAANVYNHYIRNQPGPIARGQGMQLGGNLNPLTNPRLARAIAFAARLQGANAMRTYVSSHPFKQLYYKRANVIRIPPKTNPLIRTPARAATTLAAASLASAPILKGTAAIFRKLTHRN